MLRFQSILRQKASESATALWIIEKDYALSYLLAGISQVPNLRNALVLKGGTALKKTYYKDYRFSEDLDFSMLDNQEIDPIREGIEHAIEKMKEILLEKGAFRVHLTPLELQKPHPRGQIAYIIRVQFPYHREPLCRLKVEITTDEVVLLPPETRKVLHDYGEGFSADIQVYQLAEIIAEKYRALLQSLDRLREKGWGANRVCRDYYDLWWILGHADINASIIRTLTTQKCALRKVSFTHPDEFFDDALIEVAFKEWDKLLSPFIPEKISLNKVLEELRAFTGSVWNES